MRVSAEVHARGNFPGPGRKVRRPSPGWESPPGWRSARLLFPEGGAEIVGSTLRVGFLEPVVGVSVLLVLDLLVVVLWVGSSELQQHIYKDAAYAKPFFLTYCATSAFVVYLAGFALPSWRRRPVA